MNKPSEATRPLLRRVALTVIFGGIAILAILFISTRGKATMVPTETASETTSDVASSIPPIDADAPTETKTATFAMG